jgi:group I intron endonuclease
MGFIYRITNIENQLIYIGQTTQTNPNARWLGHKRAVRYGNGCPVLSNAIKHYGIEKFKFEVILTCPNEDLDHHEIEYIKEYNTLVPNGYNVQEGGNFGGMFNGHHHTEEAKRCLSEKSAAYYSNPDIRKAHGEKVKEALKNSEKWKLALAENRAQRKGVPIRAGSRTEEHRKKISEGVKKWYENNSTEDIHKKQSKIMTGINGKRVNQYTNEGTYINEYPSIAEGARQNGLTRKNVQACVSGRSKTAGGFMWKYVTTEEV